MPQAWTFTLLGQPTNGAPTSLPLTGWQAPFGRPRKGPIVDLGTSIREQTTYFPGSNVPPVVHAFGSRRPDFELHGRWMDFAIGAKTGAHAFAKQWRDFVEAQLPVNAQWGNLLSYEVFIKEIKLQYESEAQIAWSLTAIVLKDNNVPPPPQIATQSETPQSISNDMLASLQDLLQPSFTPGLGDTVRGVLALLPEISDSLDTIVSNVNAPFSTIADVCNSLSDFETAISSDLSNLGSSLAAAKAAILEFRETTDNLLTAMTTLNGVATASNPAGALFTAADVAEVAAEKAASDAAAANLLALIADMLNDLDATSRGASVRKYMAQLGDTWESIATATLGSPQGARAIRDLNGVRYGDKPLPGKTYSIPSRA